MYYLMDGRANYDVDSAVVLDCCETLEDAHENWESYGADTCIVDSETMQLVDSLMWNALGGK